MLATGLLLWLVRAAEVQLVQPLLPALAELVGVVESRFDVGSAVLVNEKTGRYIELQVRLLQALQVGSRTLQPRFELWIPLQALAANVLQPLVPFLAIVVACPCRWGWREAVKRVGWAVPALLLLLLTNVPLAFNGMMLDFRAVAPEASVDPLVYWMDFLLTGGSLVLAIGAAMLVVGHAARHRVSV